MASLPTRIRRGGRSVLLVATMVCGTTTAGILGTGGVARAASTDGQIAVGSCTSVAASVTYSPGLRKAKAKTGKATLNDIISGCSVFSEPIDGTGTISAALSGRANYDAENFTGTFSITWPGSSGLSSSDGSPVVTDSGGTESFSGTVTSGAFPGGLLRLDLITTSHSGKGTKKSPLTSQLFTSTEALTVSQPAG